MLTPSTAWSCSAHLCLTRATRATGGRSTLARVRKVVHRRCLCRLASDSTDLIYIRSQTTAAGVASRRAHHVRSLRAQSCPMHESCRAVQYARARLFSAQDSPSSCRTKTLRRRICTNHLWCAVALLWARASERRRMRYNNNNENNRRRRKKNIMITRIAEIPKMSSISWCELTTSMWPNQKQPTRPRGGFCSEEEQRSKVQQQVAIDWPIRSFNCCTIRSERKWSK